VLVIIKHVRHVAGYHTSMHVCVLCATIKINLAIYHYYNVPA